MLVIAIQPPPGVSYGTGALLPLSSLRSGGLLPKGQRGQLWNWCSGVAPLGATKLQRLLWVSYATGALLPLSSLRSGGLHDGWQRVSYATALKKVNTAYLGQMVIQR
ncbi:hypothetical protein [Absidia glauca]|uniref:Uncharacterized protein n=1 Tax=Absidia glauca TaxID=4829 RepID=A0A168RTB4_ABSGL|nr:hypothetical protein [Absidia glauca]